MSFDLEIDLIGTSDETNNLISNQNTSFIKMSVYNKQEQMVEKENKVSANYYDICAHKTSIYM